MLSSPPQELCSPSPRAPSRCLSLSVTAACAAGSLHRGHPASRAAWPRVCPDPLVRGSRDPFLK